METSTYGAPDKSDLLVIVVPFLRFPHQQLRPRRNRFCATIQGHSQPNEPSIDRAAKAREELVRMCRG